MLNYFAPLKQCLPVCETSFVSSSKSLFREHTDKVFKSKIDKLFKVLFSTDILGVEVMHFSDAN